MTAAAAGRDVRRQLRQFNDELGERYETDARKCEDCWTGSMRAECMGC